MGADLFNDASAVFPILILAKIAERQRRALAKKPSVDVRYHRWFVGLGLVGLIVALVGAVDANVRNWLLAAILGLILLICLAFFAGELLGKETA